MVSNRDIGFVHPGQDAEIKVDTFTFTRYGLLHGKVVSISRDAIARDKLQDKPNEKEPPAATTPAASPRARSCPMRRATARTRSGIARMT